MIISTCIWNRVWKDFGAPLIKKPFWPFIFFLKNNKYWSAWQLERTTSHNFTVFTTYWANRLNYFYNFWQNFVCNKSYANNAANECAKYFFLFSFIKKRKARHARFSVRDFILFILPVPQLLLRTDAKSYRPIL